MTDMMPKQKQRPLSMWDPKVTQNFERIIVLSYKTL